MIIDKNIVIERTNKKPILLDLFYNQENTNQPIVIFCHGYKGFKDWGAWDLMAKAISDKGFCFLKFNFSHNGGTVENPIDFPDLEAFGHNNYTKELDDLNDVLDWIQKHFKNDSKVDINEISLIGHSRGGGITILKASEDHRISKLVSLASVSNYASRFGSESNIKQWQKDGVKYVINGRTKQEMPHYYQFFEDFKANEERLNIRKATKSINIPHLVIHGSHDTSVKLEESEALHRWNPKSQLKIIEGANHVFNTSHPWQKDELSIELQEVVAEIITFLNS